MGEDLLHEVRGLLKAGELHKAKTILLTLIQEEPDHPEIQFLCGSVHDALGQEKEAISFYNAALHLGISGVHREETYIQLGSSLRAIGEYEKAKQILTEGLAEYPDNAAMHIFFAMTLYNLGNCKEAISRLLKITAQNKNDEWLKKYQKAVMFYADHLDHKW